MVDNVIVACDANNCVNTSSITKMVLIDGYTICEECSDNLYNSTGYCSIPCQLGYGCDQSC